MPELPEVETTVLGLKEKVLKRTFLDLWTDAPKIIKHDLKKIKGKKILSIERRGKNILINLENDLVLLIHLKISGHLLYGKWEKKGKQWVSKTSGPIKEDDRNRFIHVLLFLNNGYALGLSDPRKFAKIELWKKKELSAKLALLGIEPLDKSFTFERFKSMLLKKKGKIKQVLMDQSFIAGIGNIYASEILFESKIHPEERTEKLKEKDIKKIYLAIKKILSKAIKLKGDSFSDYRTISGEKGRFNDFARVYGRKGEKCYKCKGLVKIIKIGGRSSYYCPSCQKKK